ncbi:MAG: hypothetical protein GF350_06880 [Chitinivibrionales bacterium]|nr:hypothetical protein [Chitinivibrionales bacterium]
MRILATITNLNKQNRINLQGYHLLVIIYFKAINQFLKGVFMKTLLLVLFAINLSLFAATWYVSPDGSDSNDGSAGSPFKTLHHARDVLRTKSGESKTVIIKDGNYFLDEPLRFDERDGGTEQNPVLWKGEDGTWPAIYGGSRITGWQPSGIANVYKAYTGSTDWEFWALSENGKRRQNARHPNQMDPSNIDGSFGNYSFLDQTYNGPLKRGNDFYYNEQDFPANFDYSHARVCVGPGWFTDAREITQVDFSTRCITVDPDLNPQRTYWLEGSKDFIDQPGEWALDNDGYIWYWPKNLPIEDQVIVGSKMNRIIEFIGSSSSDPVQYVTVEGLLVSTADSPDTVYSSKSSPQSPGSENHENNCEIDEMRHGLVHFENAGHCAVRFCKLWNAGTMGVVFNYHSQYNTMYGCWLEGVNYHAVYLGSYCILDGPWDYINHHNTIQNNYIHDYGKLSAGCAGVNVYQSGDNEISYNEIRRAPRYGISVKGQRLAGYPSMAGQEETFLLSKNNNMHHNDISHVIHSTADVGAHEQWNPGPNNKLYNTLYHDLNHIWCPSRTHETNGDDFNCGLSYRNCVYHDAGFSSETYNIAAYNCVDVMNWWMEGGFKNMPYPFTRSTAVKYAGALGFSIDDIGVKDDFPWETPAQKNLEYEFPDEMVTDPDLFDVLGPDFADGAGLNAEYYASSSLSGTPSETKIEPYLGINWDDQKNVRLTGSIVPYYSSEYRFCANVRGTIKVMVNNQTVVDGQASGELVIGEYITLQKGTPYPFSVEFTGGDAMGVDWWCKEMPVHVIPQSQLYPPGEVDIAPSAAVHAKQKLVVAGTNKEIMISVPSTEARYSIQLIRPDGSVITPEKISVAGKTVISSADYAAGIYIVCLRMENRRTFHKIAVER